jgi:flagellar biosynthetic protein FlhB
MRQKKGDSLSLEIYEADIVITNPWHYAVALKYDAKEESLPVVVMMGVDDTALKIVEEAKQYEIPVCEYPPLARELYASGKVGFEIPNRLHEAAFVALFTVKTGIYKVG